MPQITLYLDDETLRLMRERAAAADMPYSRWVAGLIRAQAASAWPPQVLADLGGHADMPLAEGGRANDVPDTQDVEW